MQICNILFPEAVWINEHNLSSKIVKNANLQQQFFFPKLQQSTEKCTYMQIWNNFSPKLQLSNQNVESKKA